MSRPHFSRNRRFRGPRIRIVDRIRAREVRVVNTADKQMNVFKHHEALKMARERHVDLVEVAETDIVYNADKSYAANVDKAVSALKSPHSPGDAATLPAIERFPTPGVRTIEELTKPPWNVPARQQIKLLLYRVASRLVLLLLTGADRLNEAKLTGVLGTAEFRPAEPEEIRGTLEADPGSLGGVGVDQLEIIADHLPKNGKELTTGANENDWHVQNGCVEHDIKVTRWEDLRTCRGRRTLPRYRRSSRNAAGHRGRPYFQTRNQIQRKPQRVHPKRSGTTTTRHHGLLWNRRHSNPPGDHRTKP